MQKQLNNNTLSESCRQIIAGQWNNTMIKIILKDKLNPHRAESCVYKTINPTKAAIFIKALKKGLIYSEWEIKTQIGEVK
jgi:hypothetical protein